MTATTTAMMIPIRVIRIDRPPLVPTTVS